MKLKKLLAFGLALVMCLAMAACGTNPGEKTDAEPVSITVTENWDFSVGFYPVITRHTSSISQSPGPCQPSIPQSIIPVELGTPCIRNKRISPRRMLRP